jgi:glutamine cyclotransferase
MNSKLFFPAAAVLLLSACNGNDKPKDNPSNTPSNNEPKQLSYTVTATYPHDTASFTEGLEFHDGFLYEGTGNKGKSKLAKTELKTGKDVQRLPLSGDYFGEGITLLNGKIYQMTYTEQKCFVYDAKTFAKLKEFTYEGEGWGLTNDGKQLIMSNGGDKIYYRSAETFEVTKTVAVTNNYGPLSSINELEYVDGFVFANIWTTNKIVKIDLNTGHVVAELNLDDLLQKHAPEALSQPNKIDVLNGIAYDAATKKFFITGKYYPKVFEIQIN